MRRTSLLLAVAALAATLLAGCVVVPYGGWGYGEYHPYYSHHYYWHRDYWHRDYSYR